MRARVWLLLVVLGLGWVCWMPLADDAPARASHEQAEPPRRERLEEGLNGLVESFGGKPGEAQALALLEVEREKWLEKDFGELGQELAEFLRSGRDRETGLPFEVGPGGRLESWPSLRVFAIEMLLLADPDLAAEVAREVLAETDSVAEYAVALKALTRGEPWRATDEELLGCLHGLLKRDEWVGEAAFCEALDLGREIGLAEGMAMIGSWMRENEATELAGRQVLHEAAAERREGVMVWLAREGNELGGELRGGLLARVDASQPAQAEALRAWWARGDVGTEERRIFLESFPLESRTVGDRLYKGEPPRDAGLAGDRAALELLGKWEAPVGLEAEMEAARARVRRWVAEGEVD